MRCQRVQGIELWESERFGSLPGVRHFITGRSGGVSPPPFHWLNLGLGLGDDPRLVRINRRRLARALGTPLVIPRQVHGARVVEVAGPDEAPLADALATATPGLTLLVLVADCLPLLLCDPDRPAVAVVHAGWRGTLRGIAGRAVRFMAERFGSRPERMHALLGPALGPCHLELPPELVGRFPPGARRGRRHLDLWKANREQLLEAGLREERVEALRVCTYCHQDRFYSHRASGGRTGRFAAGISLDPGARM